MRRDPIVEEKHRVQRELAREAGEGVDAYFHLLDRVVDESLRRRGLTLRVADLPVPPPALAVADAPSPYRAQPLPPPPARQRRKA